MLLRFTGFDSGCEAERKYLVVPHLKFLVPLSACLSDRRLKLNLSQTDLQSNDYRAGNLSRPSRPGDGSGYQLDGFVTQFARFAVTTAHAEQLPAVSAE